MSGTHRAAQLYFENDEITTLSPPFNAVLSMSAAGVQIGVYFNANGSLLNSGWSGSLAASIAANISGTVGHTNNLNFAKLTFAQGQNWTYSAVKDIDLTIQVQKDGDISQNSGNVLQMPIRLSQGTTYGMEDIWVDDAILYLPYFLSEGVANQGIDTIRLDNTWSKNNWRAQVANSVGLHARPYDDSTSPTGKSLIVRGFNLILAPIPRASLFRVQITSFDVDGFPNWGTPLYINGEGSPGVATTGPAPIDINQVLTANGMPVLCTGRYAPGSAGSGGNILVNQGTLAAPAYTAFLLLTNIDTQLRATTILRSDSAGKIYLPSANSIGTVFYMSRLVFTGTNNDVASLTTPGNWTRERIGTSPGGSPAASGLGDVAQFRLWGIAVDEDNLVNGEPTIYATDNIDHIIFKITREATSLGDERDWLFTIWAGGNGTPGDNDGTGTAARFNNPRGIFYKDGFLWVADKGNRLVRRIDVSNASVTTFYGQSGVLAHTDQFSF